MPMSFSKSGQWHNFLTKQAIPSVPGVKRKKVHHAFHTNECNAKASQIQHDDHQFPHTSTSKASPAMHMCISESGQWHDLLA